MAAKAVVDAVEARLEANWTATPIRGVNLDGEAPADGSAFLLVQYPVANSEPITIGAPGANVWREEGSFRLVLNASRGSGIAAGLALADQLADLFRGKIFGDVTTLGPTSPSIDDRNDDGNYFILSVVCPYTYDIFG